MSANDVAADRAAEPIHRPGTIQPHGALLVLDEPGLSVLQASENVSSLLGVPSPQVGAPLAGILGTAVADRVREGLRGADVDGRPLLVGRERIGTASCDLTVHRHAGRLILEIEPTPERPAEAPIYDLVRSFVARLRDAGSIEAMCALATREVRRMTGFDHVMVYAFDADGHGEVLAEDVEAGHGAGCLGHRFPASDCPAHAREPCRRNPIRLVPDADYRPARLVPQLDPRTGAPADLTFAVLRGVSPLHLESMRAMGTRASMSASILVAGTLWGRISCHHPRPRHAPYPVRAALEHLAQVLSLQIEGHVERREIDHRLELRALLVAMLEALGRTDGSLLNLTQPEDGAMLLRFGGATGAAVVEKGRLATVGRTPDEPTLLALVEWLAGRGDEVFATDCLAECFEPAPGHRSVAGGLLAVAVSKLHRDFVLWFRPEVVRDLRAEPRRGRAEAWRRSELDLATELRNALLGIVLRKAEEVAQLARELERINRELEAFSYSVSHDLRAPLRHIAGYAELIAGAGESALSERERRYVANIKDAAAFAGLLVDALLSFSRIGRTEIKRVTVDLDALVAGVVCTLALPEDREVEWRIDPLPAVQGDPLLLRLAVENLLSNAVKYSAPRPRPVIEIHAVRDEAQGLHGLSVVDNGVGFDMKYAHKLFGVFQRLHAMDDFEGTGIGLANVRRVAERHGGRALAHGEVDRGATFTLLLPMTPC